MRNAGQIKFLAGKAGPRISLRLSGTPILCRREDFWPQSAMTYDLAEYLCLTRQSKNYHDANYNDGCDNHEERDNYRTPGCDSSFDVIVDALARNGQLVQCLIAH